MNSSYVLLRRIIGIIGIVFPIILVIEGYGLHHAVLPSLSDYYSLRTRDVFVGFLMTIGWFFFVYRGYDRVDAAVGKVAWLSAMGVALFPNSGSSLDHTIHFVSALTLFSMLAVYDLVLFTRTSGTMTAEKIVRNKLYRTCGWIIVGCIGGVIYTATHPSTDKYSAMLIVETVALWAFGLAWLVKGNTLWRDK